MREWTAGGWQAELARPDAERAVFVHTPLCGTCKLARRMLDVVERMLPGLRLAEADLNVMPGLAERFRIESVPCLLIREADGNWEKLYRFGSVVELSEALRPLA